MTDLLGEHVERERVLLVPQVVTDDALIVFHEHREENQVLNVTVAGDQVVHHGALIVYTALYTAKQSVHHIVLIIYT